MGSAGPEEVDETAACGGFGLEEKREREKGNCTRRKVGRIWKREGERFEIVFGTLELLLFF
jgi:hypothetical protein